MRIILARHDKERYHFRLGYFVIFATNQIPRVGCPPRKMGLQDTNGRFLHFKTTLHRCLAAQVSDYLGINCFQFLHGRRGLAFPFIPKCLLSSRLWVMKSTREKEQHRKECFSQAGSLSVLFDRSHLGNIFGRWSGSRRTVFLRQLISLYGTEIWEITGSWSNFWCCPAAAMNGNEKGSPLPILFFVSSWDGLYICPLFVFLFMV